MTAVRRTVPFQVVINFHMMEQGRSNECLPRCFKADGGVCFRRRNAHEQDYFHRGSRGTSKDGNCLPLRTGRNRWCTGRQAVVEVVSAPIMLLNEAVSVFVAELDFPEQDYFHRAPRGTLFAT